jgi:hypothetical protein
MLDDLDRELTRRGLRFVRYADDCTQAICHLVEQIDYGHFMRSVQFDFGSEHGYLLWLNPTGLQVARVKPE